MSRYKEAIIYVAGILDGEARLTIKSQPEKWKSGPFQWRLEISNYSRKMLYFIKNTLGVGRVRCSRKPKRKYKFYYYGIHAYNQIISVLKKLLPYLIIKRQLAIEFIKFFDIYQPKRGPIKHIITKEIHDQYQKVRTLIDKRGSDED